MTPSCPSRLSSVLLGAFLIMDLFVGAVVESFNEMRWQAGGSLFLTKKQQMWAKTQRIAMRIRTRPRFRSRNSWWEALAHNTATHPYFEPAIRSEEHTSELQSLMRISYPVFC